MRTINKRFLLLLIVSAAVLTAVVAGVHVLQTGRIAEGLMYQAERSEEQNHPDQAAKFLARYLELNPEDIEARARLGRILAAQAPHAGLRGRERALFVLEKLLLRAPDRLEERRLIVPIAIELKRFELARDHLKILHRELPEDDGIERLFAQCYQAQYQYGEAAEWYRKAIAHAPHRLDNYVNLADLLRRKIEPTKPGKFAREADKVIEALVAANGSEAGAFLARWNYRREWTPPGTAEARKTAEADVARAEELDPEGADTILAVAEVNDRNGKRDQAVAKLRKGIEEHPRDARLYRALAALKMRGGHGDEAAACLRDGAQNLSGTARQDLLWAEANVRIDRGEVAEAEAVIVQLRKARCSRTALEYLQARLLIHAGQWSQAADMLTYLRPLIEDQLDLTESVDLFLGRCYEQLGEPLEQLASYKRALKSNPASIPALQGLVDAFTALGRLDEALEQTALMMRQAGAPPTGWIQIARLSLLRTLPLPRPDWQALDEVFDRAEKEVPDAVDIPLLRAEALLARRQLDRARAVLTKARASQPKQVRFVTALAELAERAGERSAADRLFEEAEKLDGDSAAIRVARARSWGRRQGKTARAALRKLTENVDKFPVSERYELLQVLAEENHRIGNLVEAQRLWGMLAAQPRHLNDLRLRLLLFQMAVQTGDEPARGALLGDLERIEHGQGTFWHFCMALHRIEAARKGDQAALDEARAHLDAVAVRRPAWSAVPLAKAEIEMCKGNWDAAIFAYHRAIDLGGRTVPVTRQLVQLLSRCRRYAEADREIRQLQQSVLSASGLGAVAVEMSLRNQDPARAVQIALETVSADSKEYRDHLWLGQVLAAANPHSKDAEKHLRRAVELDDKAPETWIALVQYLAGAQRQPEGEQTLREAKAKIPSATAPAALAPCHEALGQLVEAEKFYRQVVDQDKNVAALRTLAEFFLRNDRSLDADPPLRRILTPELKASKDDAAWARRQLATVLANDPARFDEALALVGLASDPSGKISEKVRLEDKEAANEQLARARILSRSPMSSQRAGGIVILEELRKKQVLDGQDLFMLAQLYDEQRSGTRARELMRDLLSSQGNNPKYLAEYVRVLLRQNQLEESQRWAEKLAEIEKARGLEPNALGAVELRAQVLLAQGKNDQAAALLVPLTQGKKVNTGIMSLLIGSYARQGRFAEALEQCTRAWDVCPPGLAAGMSIAVLRSGAVDRAEWARVDARLQKELAKDEKPGIDLLFVLADLRDLQGRYSDAEAAYRLLLARQPNNWMALNNLAWLLAVKEDMGNEALPLINRAIELAGARADLLDTRAMVFLARNNHDGARQDLEKVTRETPAATQYFHLARAHRMAKDLPAASAALKQALAAGLDLKQLHPLEQPALKQLMEELPPR